MRGPDHKPQKKLDVVDTVLESLNRVGIGKRLSDDAAFIRQLLDGLPESGQLAAIRILNKVLDAEEDADERKRIDDELRARKRHAAIPANSAVTPPMSQWKRYLIGSIVFVISAIAPTKVAEGTKDEFIRLTNERVRELGLDKTALYAKPVTAAELVSRSHDNFLETAKETNLTDQTKAFLRILAPYTGAPRIHLPTILKSDLERYEATRRALDRQHIRTERAQNHNDKDSKLEHITHTIGDSIVDVVTEMSHPSFQSKYQDDLDRFTLIEFRAPDIMTVEALQRAVEKELHTYTTELQARAIDGWKSLRSIHPYLTNAHLELLMNDIQSVTAKQLVADMAHNVLPDAFQGHRDLIFGELLHKGGLEFLLRLPPNDEQLDESNPLRSWSRLLRTEDPSKEWVDQNAQYYSSLRQLIRAHIDQRITTFCVALDTQPVTPETMFTQSPDERE